VAAQRSARLESRAPAGASRRGRRFLVAVASFPPAWRSRWGSENLSAPFLPLRSQAAPNPARLPSCPREKAPGGAGPLSGCEVETSPRPPRMAGGPGLPAAPAPGSPCCPRSVPPRRPPSSTFALPLQTRVRYRRQVRGARRPELRRQ
jgi:hypothetical protein